VPSIDHFGPRYDRVRFVMGATDSDVAADLKETLHARGVHHAQECGATDHLFSALDAEIVDVLMYDYDLLGLDYIEVMQKIRRKVRGQNPFLIIVATVANSGFENVRRLISAGVDDLIVKPITADRVIQSLNTFSRKRKPFVVSHDYVGPLHRRGNGAEVAGQQVIRVPNTLRSRAIEGVSDAELEKMVTTAVERLEEKRLDAFDLAIARLSTQIAEFHTQASKPPHDKADFEAALGELEFIAAELRDRCHFTPFARVADLATMLIAIVHRLFRKPISRAAVDVQLLEKLSMAIHRALTVERQSVGVMQEIASAVSEYTLKS